MITTAPAVRAESSPRLSVTILLRTLWPGSFARLAIEEAANLPGQGVDAVEVVAFAAYEAGYRYEDLVAARGIAVRIPRVSRLAQRVSRRVARPFLPPIRGEESAVPWWEILRWAVDRTSTPTVIYGEDQLVGAGAWLRRRLHGTPYVLLIAEPLATREGIAVLQVGQGRKLGRLARRVIHRTERAVLREASALVFVSRRTAGRIQAEFPGLSIRDPQVLVPGCQPATEPPQRPQGPPTVLAVSKWDQGRHPDFFLEIARQRTEQFVIAGTWIDAGSEARFRERCQQLLGAESGRVRVTGPLAEAELQAQLRGAYCYVHWNPEGFGMGVLEAMAAGVPVVCTARAGAAELIEDGVNGLLVPEQHPAAYAAAIARLTGDPAFRDVLALGAWRTARENDWARHARHLAQVLRAAVSAETAPSRRR